MNPVLHRARIGLFLTLLASTLASLALADTLKTHADAPGSERSELARYGVHNEQLIVVRGEVSDPVRAAYLQENYDVWFYRPSTGQLDMLIAAAALPGLHKAGYRFTELPDWTRNVRQVGKSSPLQAAGIPGFACYRTVEETYARMDALAQLHPDLVSTQTLGSSYLQSVNQGGYPIRAMVLERQNGIEKAPLMLIAAIHAREYTTAETALRWAERLLERDAARDPDVQWLLAHRKLVIVPIANPDGRKRAEAGASWRRNVRPTCAVNPNNIGVDLNRNSSFLWGTNNGSSTDVCNNTYRGPSAASEPEVQALQSAMAQLFTDQRGPNFTDAAPVDASGVFISMHSYSDLVLFPWGAQATDAPNLAGLRSLARKMGHFTRYTVCQPPATGCLYAASGTTDDYSYGEFGVASMTFELGNTGFFEACSTFEAQTLPKMLPALDYALKAARRPYQESGGPEVTDVVLSPQPAGLLIRAIADDTRSFSNGQGEEAMQAIVGVELHFSPPWMSSGPPVAVFQASDGGFDQTRESVSLSLPSSLLPNTPQLGYLVARDASGVQGVPTAFWLQDSWLTNGFE